MMFFFSSRRRHTRFDCDWSSDVCSSDLTTFTPDTIKGVTFPTGLMPGLAGMMDQFAIVRSMQAWALVHSLRSEERREGKSVDVGWGVCSGTHNHVQRL